MRLTALNEIATQRLYNDNFRGLDKRPRAGAGAFSDMENMQGAPSPLIATRQRRGLVCHIASPHAMTAAGRIAYIDGNTLYYNHEKTPIDNLSEEESMMPKHMAVLGAYIVVFPDGLYYNTVQPEDYGSINRLWQQTAGSKADISLCAMDGTIFTDEEIYAGIAPPEDPEDGEYWMDKSGEDHVLRRWNELGGAWVGIASVYVRISAAGIGKDLKRNDGVEISGIAYAGADSEMKAQLEALNGTSVIQACGNDYIVITGILDQNHSQTSGIRADRKAPKMDYVIECNNRLWGCRHGETDGQPLNEIYASALGDFKNWRKYTGTQGAYAVSVGTDGPFTGAINHRGYPYFFKEHYLHKVLGDNPGNFQMQTTTLDGVQNGSGKSLASSNGVLYYLSNHHVNMLESLPQDIGQALGDEWMHGGVAGVHDGVYYISMANEKGEYAIYTMDTQTGYWHKEDGKRAVAFAKVGRELYMLEDNGDLWAMTGTEGEKEKELPWRIDSAIFGYEYPDYKYLSRYNIRMKLGRWAECKIFIEYDSSGIWEMKGHMRGRDVVKTYTLPIVPRRCDHMRIRLEGNGEMQLYSIARILEMGADG